MFIRLDLRNWGLVFSPSPGDEEGIVESLVRSAGQPLYRDAVTGEGQNISMTVRLKGHKPFKLVPSTLVDTNVMEDFIGPAYEIGAGLRIIGDGKSSDGYTGVLLRYNGRCRECRGLLLWPAEVDEHLCYLCSSQCGHEWKFLPTANPQVFCKKCYSPRPPDPDQARPGKKYLAWLVA